MASHILPHSLDVTWWKLDNTQSPETHPPTNQPVTTKHTHFEWTYRKTSALTSVKFTCQKNSGKTLTDFKWLCFSTTPTRQYLPTLPPTALRCLRLTMFLFFTIYKFIPPLGHQLFTITQFKSLYCHLHIYASFIWRARWWGRPHSGNGALNLNNHVTATFWENAIFKTFLHSEQQWEKFCRAPANHN